MAIYQIAHTHSSLSIPVSILVQLSETQYIWLLKLLACQSLPNHIIT